MTTNIFNTVFENSLRLLLLLNTCSAPLTLDKLYALDFIIIYGKDFGISDTNLNGDNQYKFSEFASKRLVVQKSLKELVFNGYVCPDITPTGILYSINELGQNYCETLDTPYANEYRNISRNAVQAFINKSEHTIISVINNKSLASLQRRKS